MSSGGRFRVAGAASSDTAAPSVAGSADDVSQPKVTRAAGSWSLGGASPQGVKSWSLNAFRYVDNEVRGRVTLTGIPQVSGANVEARLSGRGVVGKLLDDEGNVLATFEGTVAAGGASGTFQHAGGGTGEWHWDGTSSSQDSANVEKTAN